MVDRNRVEDQMDGMLSEFTGVDTTPAPEQKGLSYGQLLIDNIVGLDNGYDSFGEKLGRAFNDDEVGFLKQAGISAWEGAKQFVSHPIQTTEEVVTDIKDSVVRLGSEDLDARLQRMYGVDYTQATDDQVNQAREAVFGDALEAANLIPAGGAALKLGRTIGRTGVAADVIGSTRALASGDLDFLGGTPTPRANTAGLSAQVSQAAPARVNPLFTPRPDGGLRGYHYDIGGRQAGSVVADFYSPARSVLETVNIPNRGLKGSEAIKLLRSNPDVRQSEIDSIVSGIDPLKRYTREELLSDFDSTAYIVTAERPSTFTESSFGVDTYENFHMQRQKLNNTEELDYQETILRARRPEGTPGFLASMGTHHTDDTIAHLRTSIQQDMDTGQKFYLIEEIQSDLVARSPRKPRGEVDFSTGFLDEADIRLRAMSGAKVMPDGARSILKSERDFLKEFALARAAEYTDIFRRRGRSSFGPDDPEYLSKAGDFLDKYANGPRSEHNRDANNAAYDYLISRGYSDSDAMYVIENVQNVSQEILAKPVEDITRAISEAPIKDEAEVVRLALQTAISDAVTSQVPRVVIPNLERILEQRFRANSAGFENGLKPNSGFYKTYVTGVNKAIEQLQQELPEMAVRSQNLPHRNIPHPGRDQFLPSNATVLDLTAYTGQDLSRLRFAEGGLAMETQMNRLMANGGLNDDGMRVDPISGNEVPPGSMAEEVRDDIPAQLSGGEYVVPADVVRYYGVKFFEDLRGEAKGGLMEMERDGRIGGEPTTAAGPAQLSPEDMAALQQIAMAAEQGGPGQIAMAEGGTVPSMNEDRLIENIISVVKSDPNLMGKLNQRGVMLYEGGMVDNKYADGGLTVGPSFNPAQWQTVGGSYFGNTQYSPQAPIENQVYRGPNGESVTIRFQNGVPLDTIPTGYVPEAQYVAPTLDLESTQVNTNRDRDRSPYVPPTPATGGDDRPTGTLDENGMYRGVSFEDPLGAAEAAVSGMGMGGFGGKALTGLGYLAAGPVGAGVAQSATIGTALSQARANLRVAQERGMDEDAAKIQKIVDDLEGRLGGFAGDITDLLASGDQRFDSAWDVFTQAGLTDRTQRATPTVTPAAAIEAVRTSGTESESRGVNYRSDSSDDGDSFGIRTATGSTAPTTSPRPTARPDNLVTSPSTRPSSDRTAEEARASAQRAADRLNKPLATRGRARGGLMGKANRT